MPTSYSYGEVLELWRYGEFFLTTLAFQIPKEYAVDLPPEIAMALTPVLPIHTIPATVDLQFPLREDYVGIVDKFSYGDTSRPGKVYLEYYLSGWPYPAGATRMFAPEYSEGFKGAIQIRLCNQTNEVSFIASDYVRFKFWNITGTADPKDVYIEFSIAGYTFHKRYYEEVYDIMMRDWVLLQRLIKLTELGIAQNALDVDRLAADGELQNLIAKTVEKAKKPFRQAVIEEYG